MCSRNSQNGVPEGLKANIFSAGQTIPLPFVEIDISLMRSQEPATGPCPEPNKSSANPHIASLPVLILSDRSCTCCYGLPKCILEKS
jgi:hypothetical protein